MIFKKQIEDLKIKSLHSDLGLIKEIFPELKGYLRTDICCGERYKENIRILSAMCMLGGADRDLDKLADITSQTFVDMLKTTHRQDLVSLDTIFQLNKEYLLRQCLNCTKEHVAKAILWLVQYRKDPKAYEEDLWLAIGELGHAEMECMEMDRSLFEGIRIEKRKLIEDQDAKVNLTQFLKG